MEMRKEFIPRPYQNMIIDHILSTPRCAVWSGMGTGKTIATLTALEALQMVEDGPALVVAPLRVATTTWPEEVLKWRHLQGMNVSAIVGTEKERIAAIKTPAAVYCTNYEQLVWLVAYWGDRWPYQTVVLDESTKVKSFRLRQGGKRAQALGSIAHTQLKRVIELTGTPASNGIKDLWGQIWFLDAGNRLGRTFSAFSSRWFRPDRSGFGLEPLQAAQKEVQDKLRDVCLTIEAKDWFDLRTPVINNIEVDLPPKARKHYRDMEKEMFTSLESGHEVEAFNAAAKTMKCLQIANGAMYIDEGATAWKELHKAKLEALESVVEEAAGMPVLVAYNFKSDLARLQKHFPQGRHLDKNPQTIKDWNAGQIPVLFAHPASAGHGLNLQDGGNILVFFGLNWNLEEHLQIAERIGPTRQMQSGYDRPVFIHRIIVRDTVDELVLERLESKREVQDILMAAMKRRKTDGRIR
jgi:SNF2 family DNA or RNA helicase